MSTINANGKESKYTELREYITQLSAKLTMVICTCIDKIIIMICHGISVTGNCIC